jgi:hypothetical protein
MFQQSIPLQVTENRIHQYTADVWRFAKASNNLGGQA